MKTVRFSIVLEACGKPEVHLLLVEPEKDKPLSNAIRSNRVMTVYQGGKGTDYARVGFEEGKSHQYLIFPKPLGAFADQQIVGLKYDLLESGGAEAEESPTPLESSQPAELAAQKTVLQAAGHVEAPKAFAAGPTDHAQFPTLKTQTQARSKKSSKSKPPAEKEREATEHANQSVDLSPAESTKLTPTESEQLAKIKDQVRKAMDFLEEGKQVAAFNVLKEIFGSSSF
jgi:hypothetical protein